MVDGYPLVEPRVNESCRRRRRQAAGSLCLALFVDGSVDLGGDHTLLAHGGKHSALKIVNTVIIVF
jgi:hypothetical protein